MSFIGKKICFPLLLLGIVLVVCCQNYQSGTWLSGWDTLHPEFNFSLYLKRVFFGVWQEHQGLGAVASQAHPAEIARMFIYYPFSFFLPQSFLRYGYFFLTLILGPLGVYYFLEKIIISKNSSLSLRRIASFGGGLLYFLNLGTLQHYYLPLEMFATQYAALGWLFLWAGQFFKNGQKKDLFLFSITTFLAVPAAHTATLFFAYFLGLSFYITSLVLFSFSKKNVYKGLVLLLATFLINSFWLLPNLYFIKNHGPEVASSKIHTQFSDQAFFTSRKFATLKDTALLKNFLFDWGEYDDEKGGFIRVFDEWTAHLEKPIATVIGYSIFFAVVLGILISIKEKNKQATALLSVFLVSFSFIANNVYPARIIFSFCQSKIPLFKEALRFPFTKFSLLLMFTFAVYFAITLDFVYQFLKKHFFNHQKIIVLLVMFLTSTTLFYYMLPAFTGHLISPSMKVKFPNEYFQSFAWLGRQGKTSRIAAFPIHTFRGWQYYRWGYEGAGFEWFGLRQPFLAREFDRWSPYNENYYWEISHAFYSGNLNLLENVLEKYQVGWLWVDENIFDPSSTKNTYFEELEQMLSTSDKIVLSQTFGKIKIYKVSLQTPVKDFIFLAQNLPIVGPTYQWSNLDQAYQDYGNYLCLIKNLKFEIGNLVYYPFRSLFSGKKQENLEFEIEEKENYFIFRKTFPEKLKNHILKIPETRKELVWVNPENLSQVKYFSPEVFYNGKELKVIIPKVEGYFSAKIDPPSDLKVQTPKNCKKASKGKIENQIVEEGQKKFLRLTALDANNCSAGFWLANLTNHLSFLVSVKSRHLQGKPLLFWLENLTVRRADIETYLPQNSDLATSYFIQPPAQSDALGYALHFDNISIGQEKSVNDLSEIRVYPLSFDFLTNLKLLKNPASSPSQTKPLENVYHPNPSFYLIKPNKTIGSGKILVLSQAFDHGWLAYQTTNWLSKILPFFGQKLENHVLVNNWANGWFLEEKTENSIAIIFWPQYLEFLGLTILFLVGFFYWLKPRNNT